MVGHLHCIESQAQFARRAGEARRSAAVSVGACASPSSAMRRPWYSATAAMLEPLATALSMARAPAPSRTASPRASDAGAVRRNGTRRGLRGERRVPLHRWRPGHRRAPARGPRGAQLLELLQRRRQQRQSQTAGQLAHGQRADRRHEDRRALEGRVPLPVLDADADHRALQRAALGVHVRGTVAARRAGPGRRRLLQRLRDVRPAVEPDVAEGGQARGGSAA